MPRIVVRMCSSRQGSKRQVHRRPPKDYRLLQGWQALEQPFACYAYVEPEMEVYPFPDRQPHLLVPYRQGIRSEAVPTYEER